jgi:hypothetical protein
MNNKGDRVFKSMAMAAAFVAMSGCGGGLFDQSCDDQRDDLVKQMGNPEEVKRYDSGDYHSWTYWYWTRGFSRTFTWGGAAGECSTSDYTFSPIT